MTEAKRLKELNAALNTLTSIETVLEDILELTSSSPKSVLHKQEELRDELASWKALVGSNETNEKEEG